ncbi:indolepyruvate oxidoreductase subunit beta [Hyperthermus butylicus]|uniref:Indolepyruvate oxidoreductase n=1 Tax=Hyperthermus butylicus (strain DSM 5456 / JCM 9403 / PLM1-5) TaxID=415426 RepID=A2BN80_HYPBU|nr:indolepyruvate oxidoreductase subunit beta [Hyperthermus butylicus]ABM81441.1 indolepyruvate oxidoreductase [Hyperthermus butylicus DSM 5456]
MNQAPKTLNIVIVGVGGQGLLTLSTIIANAALSRGLPALVSETHGLSQRGGTVIVHVRLGEADAPLIPEGAGDVLLSMELIEAIRYLPYLSRNGVAVVNDYMIPPPLPKVEVPTRDEILDELRERSRKLIVVPATEIALKLGDVRVANMALLGAALEAGVFQGTIGFDDIEKAIRRAFPRAAEINIRALHEGAKAAKTL